MNNVIPQLLNSANIYNSGGNEMLGIANVEVPALEALTTEIKGLGVSGSFNAPSIGNVSSMTMKLAFTTVCDDFFMLAEPRSRTIDIMAAIQDYDATEGEFAFRGYHITCTGVPKIVTPGVVDPSNPMNAAVDMELTYIKITYNDKDVLEYDRFNSRYSVNGTDYKKQILPLLGK